MLKRTNLPNSSSTLGSRFAGANSTRSTRNSNASNDSPEKVPQHHKSSANKNSNEEEFFQLNSAASVRQIIQSIGCTPLNIPSPPASSTETPVASNNS